MFLVYVELAVLRVEDGELGEGLFIGSGGRFTDGRSFPQ